MKTFIIIICCFISICSFAQKGAFGEDIKTEEEKIEEKIDKVTGETTGKTRKANVNSTDKSGENRRIPNKGKATTAPIVTKTYSIVLFESDNPIDITHKAMKLYGTKLFYRQIPNGEYYYMVGMFKTAAEAKKFLEGVSVHFPKATMVNDMDHPHIRI